jgi:hypothetical protein
MLQLLSVPRGLAQTCERREKGNKREGDLSRSIHNRGVVEAYHIHRKSTQMYRGQVSSHPNAMPPNNQRTNHLTDCPIPYAVASINRCNRRIHNISLKLALCILIIRLPKPRPT